ncbi:MAG: serine--tRNA ligase [Candidatus Eisenbacteria bacterium]
MLDLKLIRQEPERVRDYLGRKGGSPHLERILELDRSHRSALQEVEAKKAERNQKGTQVPLLKKEGKDASALLEEMKQLAEEIRALDARVKEAEEELEEKLRWLPNLPHESVPVGPDSSANVEVRRWGQIPTPAFSVKPHYDIGEELGLLDFKRGAKISGAGFVAFTGWGARLQRALIQFFLDYHREHHGFVEVSIPYVVRRESMFGTGQLPKMEEDMYRCNEDDLFLIPTAEVPITNLYREDESLRQEELPIYRMGYSPCFRREAGTYGKETRGLVRVHQFDKVELVKIVTPESSYDELESLVKCAEAILVALELPYRVLALASGDLSFAAAKCYDLEAWAAAEGRWLEVSSCSNFEAFQARRMGLRFRNAEGKLVYAHTLNGSGLALPRIIVAILENYQTERGTVTVPKVLRPYLGGLEEFTPSPVR